MGCQIRNEGLGPNYTYPVKGSCEAAELFHGRCPASLRRTAA